MNEPATGQARPHYRQVGDSALLIEFANRIDPAVNRQVLALLTALDSQRIAGLLDAIPAYRTILLVYDPLRLTSAALRQALDDLLPTVVSTEKGVPSRQITIPVLYGGDHGPDLDAVAAHCQLPAEEVIVRHSGVTYTVYFLGFSPGYPYLGGLDPALITPRRQSPRTLVPAGSVAIGGQQTGVYPQATPGGWQLIGHTPLRLFDPTAANPFLLRAGDTVRFRPLAANEYDLLVEQDRATHERQTADPDTGNEPALLVEQPGLQTTVQDLGRLGSGRYGVPASGALDDGALRLANALVGNALETAALEITLVGPTLTVSGDKTVAIALTGATCKASLNEQPLPQWTTVYCQPGDRLQIGPCVAGARAYLACSGGFALPAVFGSQSTDLLGKIGGLQGRALQVGDRLPLRPPGDLPLRQSVPESLRPSLGQEYQVRVLLGPQDDHLTAQARDTFLQAAYTVAHDSDRIGVRLQGPALDFAPESSGADILSEGIATGAVQVPANGQPIVLLAGHQTTGGYAKVATVITADLWRLGQARPGDTIRFTRTTLADAHSALVAYRTSTEISSLVPLPLEEHPMPANDNRAALAADLEQTAATTVWTPAALADLVERAAAAGVVSLRLDSPQVRLSLQRVGADDQPATQTAAASASPTPPETVDDSTAITITAPVLGIFYRGARPDEPPYVAVGQAVATGAIVGLIEVMKTFHEVICETAGTITATLVDNGASVQYGQALFTLEPGTGATTECDETPAAAPNQDESANTTADTTP